MGPMKYQSVARGVASLGSVVPQQLFADTTRALSKLDEALGHDVSGYVANRLHMSMDELKDALAAEQVDGVALAMYNIEKRAQALIIGDQTGVGKGRQAAAMIRYGLNAGYLPIFFTDRYTLFSDMYRDCKALGIKDARPLVVNAGVSVFDFDNFIDDDAETVYPDDVWSPADDDEDNEKFDETLTNIYQKQYEVVYKAPPRNTLQEIFKSGDVSLDSYDYLMVTYSQLKDARKDSTRLDFLQSLCEKHRVLFIFDEAHRCSSVSAGNLSVITQGINKILSETPQTQCVFLSATFAKRAESFITFMNRTALSALATESTLKDALRNGGVPMQEYVSSKLAAEGQMIRREHSSEGIPTPVYTYLDDELPRHAELFDKVMYFFREMVKLSSMVSYFVSKCKDHHIRLHFNCYPTRAQLFYVNKVLLLSLKAAKVAQVAVDEVKQGKSVVIGMSDTLECVLNDVQVHEKGIVPGDISVMLLRLLEKTVRSSKDSLDRATPIFDILRDVDDPVSDDLIEAANEIRDYYKFIKHSIKDEVFHLPQSPIDVIRQLITKEQFVAPDGRLVNIRFEECTGRAHQLEYLSPEGDDDFTKAKVLPRRKRHSNHIYNDFQNNKLDVILINACGAIGASAHAAATAEVSDAQVRQRKMLIVQNDLDVNIDLQKRGRINRTGQRMDLPPLYEYIITAIPSEKRLNMMLRAKLRSLSANTAAWQDHDREQADFTDINNKYGNDVASDYIKDNQELGFMLGLKGKVTASKLMARIAMLSVTAQQDIVDDLMTAYATLEAELRRINQWDLEREFRDFEAEFVCEELFTTAKAESKLGGCSYLSTYKCKQKTYPYSFEAVKDLCAKAEEEFGPDYVNNAALQKQVRAYFTARKKVITKRFEERRASLLQGAKRVIVNYCGDEVQADDWLQRAAGVQSDYWPSDYFNDVVGLKNEVLIMRKLTSYSNEFHRLVTREKLELKKLLREKKRLVEVLSYAVIGSGFSDISTLLDNEGAPSRVIAILRDIRFGKENSSKFLPSRVELVFALSAVQTDVRINLVHNNKWSNYEKVMQILFSQSWRPNKKEWDKEIAANNNKIVERKIITGNILGAYVHPAIAELSPRFITFSLNRKEEVSDEPQTQIGLLLPFDESRIRETIQSISLPLNEGIKYALNAKNSYTIAGLGVDFSILPYRVSDASLKFVICVKDEHSRDFETDDRFDEIRGFFVSSILSSIHERKKPGRKSNKPSLHYQTRQLDFDSQPFQKIIQTLAQLDAVIIVPRDHVTRGTVNELISRSERDANQPWESLDWKNEEVVLPPVKEKTTLSISAPDLNNVYVEKTVSKHSELYQLAENAMVLLEMPLAIQGTVDALRRVYMSWINYSPTKKDLPHNVSVQDLYDVCDELRIVIGNKSKVKTVDFNPKVKKTLKSILLSERLSPEGSCLAKFEKEMLFLSPDIDVAQTFIDEMPYSPKLDKVRQCVLDYIEGKTLIISSPDDYS